MKRMAWGGALEEGGRGCWKLRDTPQEDLFVLWLEPLHECLCHVLHWCGTFLTHTALEGFIVKRKNNKIQPLHHKVTQAEDQQEEELSDIILIYGPRKALHCFLSIRLLEYLFDINLHANKIKKDMMLIYTQCLRSLCIVERQLRYVLWNKSKSILILI